MKVLRSIFLWLFPAVVLSVGTSLLEAQVSPVGKPVTIRGKITSVKGQELLVAAASGEVLVKVPEAATIRGEVAIKFSDIAPGMYLGTTAQKQPDGTFRASEVHIFSEEERGTVREGHRPSSSVPNSTMTNANVEKVEEMAVQEVKGRMLTLKYKEGGVRVFVPPNTRVVRRVSGGREILKPGAEVVIQATQATDGSISASRITVNAGGNMPRM